LGEAQNLKKVVALAMKIIARKLSDEPVMPVEEEAIDYEAWSFKNIK